MSTEQATYVPTTACISRDTVMMGITSTERGLTFAYHVVNPTARGFYDGWVTVFW